MLIQRARRQSERGAMVPEAPIRLEHDDVEPERESRERFSATQRSPIQQAVRPRPDPRPLPMVDRLLGQPEFAGAPTSDLDHDQRGRRNWIDRNQVQLEATHPHVAREDPPPCGFQPARDLILGSVASSLRVRSGSRG